MKTEQLEKTSMQVSKFIKYNHSKKGRARNQRYEDAHPNRQGTAYIRDYRAKCRELAGGEFREQFPGYRFITALRTAEIVEI